MCINHFSFTWATRLHPTIKENEAEDWLFALPFMTVHQNPNMVTEYYYFQRLNQAQKQANSLQQQSN